MLVLIAMSVELYSTLLTASERRLEEKPVQVYGSIVLEEGKFPGNRKILVSLWIVNPNDFHRPIDWLTVCAEPPLELVVDQERILLGSFTGSVEGGQFWQGRLYVFRQSTAELNFRVFAIFPDEKATCRIVLKSSHVTTYGADVVKIDAPAKFVRDLGNWFSWKDEMFTGGWSLNSSGGSSWEWAPTQRGVVMGGEDWLSLKKGLEGLRISECTYMALRYRVSSGKGRFSIFLVWNDIFGTLTRTPVHSSSSYVWTTATVNLERFAHSPSTLVRIELATETSVLVEIEYILFFGR